MNDAPFVRFCLNVTASFCVTSSRSLQHIDESIFAVDAVAVDFGCIVDFDQVVVLIVANCQDDGRRIDEKHAFAIAFGEFKGMIFQFGKAGHGNVRIAGIDSPHARKTGDHVELQSIDELVDVFFAENDQIAPTLAVGKRDLISGFFLIFTVGVRGVEYGQTELEACGEDGKIGVTVQSDSERAFRLQFLQTREKFPSCADIANGTDDAVP